ncbi:VOC family protein [Actinocorallia longicatena]|uniref:VOC family protein n=1 Tax=Actinocorallia longicatena TaxID=111803 RepID=A0ABP6QJ91_9ACTN
MASRLNPYISFPDGTARAALEFYEKVLGGELTLHTFGEYGTEGDGAAGIMHGALVTAEGYTIMGADIPPGMPVTVGNNVAVSLSGDDAELLRAYYAGLSEGGTVTVPLAVQMWGDEFGAFTDRFGISWMVNIASS